MANFLFNPRKQVLVIEIGKASLKVAFFLRSSAKLELLDYSLAKINPSIDAVSQIIDFIHGFVKKNSVIVKEAVLSITDTDVVAIKYCLLPALKHSEILNAAIWQLKDEVHFDLGRAYSNWCLVKEITDEQGARQQGIIFAFCQKEAVEKYISCLQECGLGTQAILTSPLNYGDILKSLTKDKAVVSEVVLDLEYLDSVLSLYIDKKLYFTRYLPVSVDGYTRSLIGTLMLDRGKVNLTLSEAEEIRDNVGIPQDASVLIKDNLYASQIISLIRPVLETMARETMHSLNYFTSILKEPAAQVIYLAGLGVNLKNLDTYLEKELNLSIKRLPFPQDIDIKRVESSRLARDSSQLLSCAGAVLLAGRGVSLLAGDVKMRWIKNVLIKRIKSFITVIGTVVLSLMLISILALPVYSYRLKKAKSFFKDKKELAPFFEKVCERKELIFDVSLQRITADALLNFISQSIPDGLCLDMLDLDQYSGELILEGGMRDISRLALFLRKLEASDYFISLKPLRAKDQGFKIKCKLKY